MIRKEELAEKEFEVYSALKTGDIEKADIMFKNKEINIFKLTDSKANWLHEILKSIPNNTPVKSVKYLINKGISPIAKDSYGVTPLQYAMRGKNIEVAKLLLALGADPNVQDNKGDLVPFKMACCIYPFNKELVELFLKYGADIYSVDNTTGETWLDIINNTKLEEWKEMKNFLNNYEAKLKAEGKLPPKSEKKIMIVDKPLHDGKSEIKIKEYDNWLEQYNELWRLLVPKRGKALIIQGEVLRVCGKLEHEILDNGRINWDNSFELMCNALKKYLISSENPLSEEDNKKIKSIILKIKKDTVKEKDFDKLTELCTKWVLLNPIPIKLKNVPYNR